MTKDIGDLIKKEEYNYVCDACNNCFKSSECVLMSLCTYCGRPTTYRIQ